MNIEKEFKSLVALYADSDSENNVCPDALSKEDLLKLDQQLTQLLNKFLLVNGPEKEKIEKNYKKLALLLHPDRRLLFKPEVSWLERQLSEGREDGVCFKTLAFCFEKLTTPGKFKEINFAGISNRDDFRQWLEQLKTQASTYTGRSLYSSLIGLLDQAGGYFDEVGQITPRGLRAIITFLPIVFASYGAIIFAEELFAIYSLYFILLKGGQYLERNSAIELQLLGRVLQDISLVTATATTTLLVRLLEMTFWISRQCFDLTLQIGTAILHPLLTAPPAPVPENEASPTASLCRDLVVASHHFAEGMQFKTPELKLLAAPLESYLGLNAQQFFSSWRLGATKRLNMETFLFSMRVLDQLPDSTDEKLIKAKEALDRLRGNPQVYVRGGHAANAVDQAEQVIDFFQQTALPVHR